MKKETNSATKDGFPGGMGSADGLDIEYSRALKQISLRCVDMLRTLGAELKGVGLLVKAPPLLGVVVLRPGEDEGHWGKIEEIPLPIAAFWDCICQTGASVLVDLANGEVTSLADAQGAWAPVAFDRTLLLQDEGLTRPSYLLAVPATGARGKLWGSGFILFSTGEPAVKLVRECFNLSRTLETICHLAATPRPSPVARPAASGALEVPVVGAAMEGVLRTLERYASLDQLILLRGATGVGKTHLARWVHYRSTRSRGPFVVADLLSMPQAGPEVALFGVVDGFFTGVKAHKGWVEQAAGGTLFIDEIDKLSLDLQSKLLRLLDERKYVVVGEGHTRQADLRLVLATNTDLPGAVREGSFREDLYYRVNGLAVEIPGLDARRDEIGSWAQFMLNKIHHQEEVRHGREGGEIRFSDEALKVLTSQDWPGNLRELESIVRRAYALRSEDFAVSAEVVRAAVANPLQRAAMSLERGGVTPALKETTLERELEEIAIRLLKLIEERRASESDALCSRRGDLAMLDWIEARILQEAIHRFGKVGRALEVLGLGHRAASGNGAREKKWIQKVFERVRLK